LTRSINIDNLLHGEPDRHPLEYAQQPYWAGDPRVNIQNDKGKAKAYQVKQVLKAIERLESEYGAQK